MVGRRNSLIDDAIDWVKNWFQQKLNNTGSNGYQDFIDNTSPVQPTPTPAQQLGSQLSSPTITPSQASEAVEQAKSGIIPNNSSQRSNGGSSRVSGRSNVSQGSSWQQQAQVQEAQQDINQALSKTPSPEVPEEIKTSIKQQQQATAYQEYLNKNEGLTSKQHFTDYETKKNIRQGIIETGKGLGSGAFYAPYDAYREGAALVGLGLFAAGSGAKTSAAEKKFMEDKPPITQLSEELAYQEFMSIFAPDINRKYETTYDESGFEIKTPIANSTTTDLIKSLAEGGEGAHFALGYSIGSFITQDIMGDWLISKAFPTPVIKGTDVQSIVLDITPSPSWEKSLVLNYDNAGKGKIIGVDLTPIPQPMIPQASSKATTLIQYGDELKEFTGYSKTSFIGRQTIAKGVSEVYSETITSPSIIGKGAELNKPAYQLDSSTLLNTFNKNVEIIETTSYIKYPLITTQEGSTIATLASKGKKGYGNIYTLTGQVENNQFTGMAGIYSKAKIPKVSERIIMDEFIPNPSSANFKTSIKKNAPKDLILNDLKTEFIINNNVKVVDPVSIKQLPYTPLGTSGAKTAAKTSLKPEELLQILSTSGAKTAAKTSLEEANIFIQESKKAQTGAKSLATIMITATPPEDIINKNKPEPINKNKPEPIITPEKINTPFNYIGKGPSNLNALNLNIIQKQGGGIKQRNKSDLSEDNDTDTGVDEDTGVDDDIDIGTKPMPPLPTPDNYIKPIIKIPSPIIPKTRIPKGFNLTMPLIKGFKTSNYRTPIIKKRFSNYTPSFSAIITGAKSFKIPTQKTWTGLELRPIIVKKKVKEDKKKWKINIFK